MKLNESQLKVWRKAIQALRNEENGGLDGEIDLGDIVATYEGYIETKGYEERETGAYIETYRYANVEISLTLYTEDEERELGFDAELTDEANEILNAA